MLRILGLIVLLIASTAASHGQFKKLKTVNLNFAPDAVTVDRPGELYVTKGKRIEQYNSSGTLLQHGELPLLPDTFEPRDGSRLFLYNREVNNYLFFPPIFSSSLQHRPVAPDSAFAIHPYFVCSAGDHDLLILDSADWSLKKVNLKTNRVMFESTIGDSTFRHQSVSYVREYQNFVFMLHDKKSILIFNMLGKLLKQIPAEGVTHFNFLGEELYYQSQDRLEFFDLFNAESRTVKLPYTPDFAVITDECLYMIRGKKLEVFSLKP